ncbi:MAG: zf-TFIIB domain-containing protein [Deltaproteobacteria bacterium]|nr:zf-TFIIB domain-containing protein [Deltaproteobacteria bacterium]
MTAEAATLRCPACGGAASPDARACPFCATHLASVRCASCAALHFAGALHCSRCGVKLRDERTGDATGRACPRCASKLVDVRGDSLSLEECPKCGGVFVDHDTIARLATDPGRRGDARAGAGVTLERTSIEPGLETVRYVRCPMCEKLMNRKNYGEVSGVIVDVCRDHGVWFDAGELTRVVEFIEKGGLEKARRVRNERDDDARRRERVRRLEDEMRPATSTSDPDIHRSLQSHGIDGIVGSIARFLFG